jgi:hypothetical protein
LNAKVASHQRPILKRLERFERLERLEPALCANSMTAALSIGCAVFIPQSDRSLRNSLQPNWHSQEKKKNAENRVGNQLATK